MAFPFEYFENSGTAAANGIFIPVSDLPGMESSELAGSVALALKESKTAFAILNRIHSILSPISFSKLGFSLTRGNPQGSADNIFSQTFTHTWQKMVSLPSAAVSLVPVPISGSNSGSGDFSILDIFPNAEKIAAGGSVAESGILIPTSEISAFSSLTHAGLSISSSSDNREWFNGLSDSLAYNLSLRSSTIASAATALTVGAVGSLTIPANYIQTADPISGILASEVPFRALIQRTNSFVIQSLLNQSTQTFDVNVQTA